MPLRAAFPICFAAATTAIAQPVPAQPAPTQPAPNQPAPAPATPTAPVDSAPAPVQTTPTPPATSKPPVEFPCPLMVEIMYAVPTGPDGDTTGDGKRDAAGDEFVELINPHDRPINLRGFRITDRNQPGQGQLKFIFPALELPPGAAVVVFNGHAQKWSGPVGDAKAAPPATNDKFAKAFAFTMKADSDKTSWANGGDYALLSDPAGNPVQCVWWGKFSEKKPDKGLIEEAPGLSKSSIQRTSLAADGTWVPHPEVAEGPFSPGALLPTFAVTPAAPPAPAPSTAPDSPAAPSAPATPSPTPSAPSTTPPAASAPRP